MSETDIYGSVIVYRSDSNEVVAIVPLTPDMPARIKDGYSARIVFDTESSAYESDDGKLIYKEVW